MRGDRGGRFRGDQPQIRRPKHLLGTGDKVSGVFFASTGGDFPSSILISFPRRGFGWFQRFVSECSAHGAQSATMLSQNIRLSSAPAVSSAPRGAKVRAPPKPPASPSSGAHGHPRASGDYIAIKCAPASPLERKPSARNRRPGAVQKVSTSNPPLSDSDRGEKKLTPTMSHCARRRSAPGRLKNKDLEMGPPDPATI